MIPSPGFVPGNFAKNNLARPYHVRFSGSKTAQKSPREIELAELEKKIQALEYAREKEKAIRAAKKKRRADKKAKYGYVDRGLWQNFLNCYKAGYSSPLPIHRRPLAFLSVDNLKYGWAKLDKHLRKQDGRSEFLDVFTIAVEFFLAVITYGAMPLLRMLFPRNATFPINKFLLAVQERAADKLKK